MNATNSVVENKLEPVGKTDGERPLVVTGQYLYESFVTPDNTDVSRMQKIRALVPVADALQIKGAADKMVEFARSKDLADGLPEKETVVINGKEAERRTRGPKEASAMNVRTAIQQVWGALKFRPEDSAVDGLTDNTGYLASQKIAKKVLDKARIDWKGDSLKTDADRERARMAREQKAETNAKLAALKNMPRLPGEDDVAHYQRALKSAQSSIEEARREAEHKLVTGLVDALYSKHGASIALAVASEVALREGVDITLNSGDDITEEEANAALEAHARAEEKAEAAQHADA